MSIFCIRRRILTFKKNNRILRNPMTRTLRRERRMRRERRTTFFRCWPKRRKRRTRRKKKSCTDYSSLRSFQLQSRNLFIQL